jgi:hypothetical protein
MALLDGVFGSPSTFKMAIEQCHRKQRLGCNLTAGHIPEELCAL